jgi:hypothetical protein
MKVSTSCVYAMRAIGTNRIKIGATTDLESRKASVQTGCPFPVEIVATWEGDRCLEIALHHKLEAFRVQGEWFEIDEAAIMEAVKGIALPQFATVYKQHSYSSRPRHDKKNSLQMSGMRYEMNFRANTDGVTLAQIRFRSTSRDRFSICVGEYLVGKLSQSQLNTLKAGRLTKPIANQLERQSNLCTEVWQKLYARSGKGNRSVKTQTRADGSLVITLPKVVESTEVAA